MAIGVGVSPAESSLDGAKGIAAVPHDPGASTRMKLAILNDFFPPEVLGGAEITSALIVGALRERGHAVSVLTSSLGRAEPAEGIHRILPRYFHPDQEGRPLSFAAKSRLDLTTYVTVRRLLRQLQPDVVLVQSVRSVSFRAVTAALSLKIPTIAYAHDDWLALRRMACRDGGPIGRLREELVYRRFRLHRIVCPSRTLRARFLEAGFPADRLTVLPHGVDTSRFTPGAPNGRDAAGLLFVGRLYRIKGAHLALQAIHCLRERGRRDLRLTVIGEGDKEYTRGLHDQAERLGLRECVRFAGNVPHDHLPEIFTRAAVVVMPSAYETFPLVALEAMACGLPVVATRVGGLPEIIQDGTDGRLVPPGDAAALADAVEPLLADRDLAARIGTAARRAVVERFSADQFVSSLESLLLRIQAGGCA